MSSNYLNILQLTHPGNPSQLAQAYEASRERYLRLTARGPLRYYRHELLKDVEQAYEAMKNQSGLDRLELSEQAQQHARTAPAPTVSGHANANTPNRPLSLLARRVNAQRTGLSAKPPVKSPVKDTTANRFSDSLTNPAVRRVWANHESNAFPVPKRSPLLSINAPPLLADASYPSRFSRKELEDLFCKEVIYRLEGDLIRYTSRQELLAIAGIWQIPLFQANLLIAQIVEAVRTERLHQPSRREARLQSTLYTRPNALSHTVMIVFGVLLFILLDLIVMGWIWGQSR